ncbi:MAG: NAD-dependent deacylase [Oligoflexia bacterium]|nr:NAD-dependent deacylase [Oligoflexia bacterium]
MDILKKKVANTNRKLNIVFLTGAGISAQSGIKTFRDHNGLWENHPVEQVATPEAFHANPTLVQKFYNQRRAQLLSDEVSFNDGHKYMTEIESSEHNVVIVTQNVDDLHERSGAKNVIHMHGELLKMKCQDCSYRNEIVEDLEVENKCPSCGATGSLRPDIVWFGEMPYHMNEIYELLEEADIFISVGTSGHVYPAAMFVQNVPTDCLKVEVNINETQISSNFDCHLVESSSSALKKIRDYILPQK